MPKDFEYLSKECHNYNEINQLDHLDKIYDKSKLNFSQQTAFTEHDNESKNSFIAVKSVGKIELIAYKDIYLLHASSNYIEIHLEDRSILHRESLSSLESKLANKQFLRVHRSYVVNLNKIKHINSELGRYNLIYLTNGKEVKLSKAYRNTLFNALGIDI